MNKQNQICTRCVMDTSDPKISFDEGVGKTITNLWEKRNDSKSNAEDEENN